MHTTSYVAKLFQWYFHYIWWFDTILQIFTPLPCITSLSHSKNQHFQEVEVFQWFSWGSLFQSRDSNTQKKHLKNNTFFTCSCLWQEVFRSLQVQVCGGEQGHNGRGHTLTTTPKDQSLKPLAEVGSQGLNLQLLKSTTLKDHALTEMSGVRENCQV